MVKNDANLEQFITNQPLSEKSESSILKVAKIRFILMPHHLLRYTFCALLYFWSGFAVAEETSDPFNTEAMLPLKPALRVDGAVGDPCADPMPKAVPNQVPDQKLLGLPDVVNLALCNNPQTRVAWANSRVQAAQVGVSKAGYLPSATLSASANHVLSGSTTGVNQSTTGKDQRNVSVTLSYLLYDFGSRSANLENARQLLAAASATQDSTVQAVFLAAVQAFYQAQATYAALDAAIESEHAAKESFAAAEARYLAGSATPADKLQAQTAYSQATLNRITIEGNQKNAQGALANMLGLDANRNVSLATANTVVIPNSFEGDIAALIEAARQHRPDLQAAAAQVKAAEASADAARAAGRPTISLTASANQYNIAGINSHNSLVGINLNVPIFSGFSTTYRVRAAEAQVDASNGQLEQLRLQVALDVWTAYQNLTTATQSLRTTADLLSSAEQSARVALGRYKAGVGSILDLLNAQSALASARQQRIQSTFNWNLNRATLAQAMGSLDASLLQTLANVSSQQPGETPPQKQDLGQPQP
jgi:TolC family type I secretion outer membrane protein